MNTKDVGSTGELICASEAVKRGYVVCMPYGDNQRYDLVIDRSGKFEKVQVKCLKPKDGKLAVNLYTVMHNKDQSDDRKYRRVQYTETDVDLLCVVNMETFEVFMIPFSEIAGLHQIILRVDETKRHDDRARYANDYKQW